jgi:hypothetical protein
MSLEEFISSMTEKDITLLNIQRCQSIEVQFERFREKALVFFECRMNGYSVSPVPSKLNDAILHLIRQYRLGEEEKLKKLLNQ